MCIPVTTTRLNEKIKTFSDFFGLSSETIMDVALLFQQSVGVQIQVVDLSNCQLITKKWTGKQLQQSEGLGGSVGCNMQAVI